MAIIVNGHRIIVSKDIFIVHNGERMGPYDGPEIRNLQLSGSVDLTDPAWRKGLEDWVPLANLMDRTPVVDRGPVPPPPPDPSSWGHSEAVRRVTTQRERDHAQLLEKKRLEAQREEELDDDPSWEILSWAWKQGLFLAKLLSQTMLVLVLWEITFLLIHFFLQIVSAKWTMTGMPSTTYAWFPLVLLASSQFFLFARFFASFLPCLSAAFCLAVDFALFVYHNNFSALWVSSIGWTQDPHRHVFQGMVCGVLSLVLLALAAGLGRGRRLSVGRWPWMR